jgi:glycosyltransferase involved in cell wall biosynthesis
VPHAITSLAGWIDSSPDAVTQAELSAWQADGLNFLGRLSDVRPAISQASVVVLPSYREGTPRSVLEGMAMGRAIITTDAPGCRETVVHGVNGLLVPPRDAGALARAMTELAGNPARVAAMGRESRRIAEEKYDAKAVALDTLRKAGILTDP